MAEATNTEGVFAGALATFGGTLRWDDEPDALVAADLADRSVFEATVEGFGKAVGSDDRPASISLWSQIYFSALIIPATALAMAGGRSVALDWTRTRVTLCPDSGRALAFHLSDDEPQGGFLPDLVEAHLAPLIAALHRHSGLSTRLFWESAGWYLVWALGEVAREHPACRPAISAILDDPTWPASRPGVLAGMKRAAAAGLTPQRRTCCLRHRIPGFGPCQGLCPLLIPAAERCPPVAAPCRTRYPSRQ